MLVTERRGTLRIIENGKLLPTPSRVYPKPRSTARAVLLDVALHPKFAENSWVYWTFNGKEGGLHGTEVARGKLGGTKDAPRMTDVQVLFKLQPKTSAGHHFGSRIVFDRDGYLFVTFGDRGDSPSKGRESACAETR